MNHVVAESVSNSCSPRVRGEGGRDLQPRVPVQPARRRHTDDSPVHQLGLAGLAVEILDRRLAACRFQAHAPPPPSRTAAIARPQPGRYRTTMAEAMH